MRAHQIVALSSLGVFTLLAAASCSSGDGGGSGGSGGASSNNTSTSGSGSGGAGPLKWYLTCGDPVCHGHTDHPGVPPCAAGEAVGAPCAKAMDQCDPNNDCNSLLVCTTSDPQHQPGGCPISRARFKHDIRYLPDGELQRVHDDLITTPLATWHYNHEPETAREHLGFIIDDNPASPAVAEGGDHVDLYGYTSMAVAAIQVQEKQIAALQQEVAALRKELEAARAASRQPSR